MKFAQHTNERKQENPNSIGSWKKKDNPHLFTETQL